MGAAIIESDEKRTPHVAESDVPSAAADVPVSRASAGQRSEIAPLRRVRRGLSRVAVAAVYAPAAAILLAGALAVLGLFGDLWRLGSALSTHALTSVPDTYDRLALAARVALVSGAFLMLLCALVVVAVGCRGRRWWRLYLIPGVPLTAVAALFVIFAVAWCAAAFSQRLGWPQQVWETLTVLALADAVVVAARIGGIGAGPLGTRRARLRGRLRGQHLASRPPMRTSRQTQPIPVVRFGPRVTGIPTPESAEPELRIDTQAPDAQGWHDAPTAEELRAAAKSGPVALDRQESDAAAAAGAA